MIWLCGLGVSDEFLSVSVEGWGVVLQEELVRCDPRHRTDLEGSTFEHRMGTVLLVGPFTRKPIGDCRIYLCD